MAPLRLLTFTTLYPNAEQPNHGIFVENRLRHLVAGGGVTSTVLAPVPYFPSGASAFGTWSRYARVPREEERAGLRVHHPRYLVIPRIGTTLAPVFLYRAAAQFLDRAVRHGLEFDAIDAHYVYPDGVAATWLGRRSRRPVVITARGSDVSLLPRYPAPRRLIRRAITASDALIAVSTSLKDALVELGAPPDKVTVLRNGVETALFRPMPRDTQREALGLSGPVLLSVGHLIERKGHHRTIEAMPDLPGFTLLIAGEGPERARLAAQITRLGLADRVRLLGSRPHAELASLYSAADALVLASSREGWANVLLEAMACGTPVVASNIWGNPEVVQSSEAGVIFEPNTPAGIAAGVKGLFAALPARGATRAYAERFSWDETTAGQRRVFEHVLGSGAAPAGR
ncbi:MAG TPA: glycosyltransferase family 4 protein [Acetobacteraceae bacterium]|nr:glycosyltransferase family 4 protein [Acetobacteraceae bacterium]